MWVNTRCHRNHRLPLLPLCTSPKLRTGTLIPPCITLGCTLPSPPCNSNKLSLPLDLALLLSFLTCSQDVPVQCIRTRAIPLKADHLQVRHLRLMEDLPQKFLRRPLTILLRNRALRILPSLLRRLRHSILSRHFLSYIILQCRHSIIQGIPTLNPLLINPSTLLRMLNT